MHVQLVDHFACKMLDMGFIYIAEEVVTITQHSCIGESEDISKYE